MNVEIVMMLRDFRKIILVNDQIKRLVSVLVTQGETVRFDESEQINPFE